MKKDDNSLFKESLRDVIAFGSLPFYLIVLGRTLIREDLRNITYQLSISLILILLVYFVFIRFNRIEIHSALVMPLFAFVNFLYLDVGFFYFSTILFLVFIASVVYLRFDRVNIILGIIVGGAASVVSWFVI